ncbi:MAG: nitrate/nitrite transporter NrtS [Phycisphaerales bacterium]
MEVIKPMSSNKTDSVHSRSAWLSVATRPSVVRRGLMYSVIVGAILIAINHGDALLRGEITLGHVLKMALTVTVPYVVSTLSSVGAIRAQQVPQNAEGSA